MHLTELLADNPSLRVISGAADKTVKQVTSDSRLVHADGLFFALKGNQTDGHNFIEEAIANAARCTQFHAASGLSINDI